MQTLTVVIAAGLLLVAASNAKGAPQRSCDAWQSASRQQISGEETWSSAVVSSENVQVFAAPEGVCGCPGSLLHKNMAAYAYRSLHGFTRVLYLDPRSGTQISGWVRSGQLQRQASPAAPI